MDVVNVDDKRQSETPGLGFVTSRIFEAAMICVGVLSVLSVVTLQAARERGRTPRRS